MIPALLALGVDLLPTLARWAFGSTSTADAVQGAIETVTGTRDADEARKLLEANPEMAVRLKVELAQIQAQAETERDKTLLEAHRLQVQDMGAARVFTTELVSRGSWLAWMPAIMSFIAVGLNAALLWALFLTTQDFATGVREVVLLITGIIIGSYKQVFDYWMGTSRGAVEMRQALQDRSK